MKKKIGLIVLISLILLALILGIIFIFLPKKVEKLSDVKLKDVMGNPIQEYSENTMPFIIELEDDKTKIYINGKKYNGERIYKVGEYNVTAIKGLKKEQSTIKINKIEKSEDNTYKIYVISETLQTLLANLNISSDVNQKGFLWTARTSTVNIEKIKNNIPNLQISKNNGEQDVKKFKELVVPELKNYIDNILKENNNACFDLYMEEDKFYLDVELFGKIGLDDSRYNVIMYTNGTLGYTREYEITQKDNYERFLSEKEKYQRN